MMTNIRLKSMRNRATNRRNRANKNKNLVSLKAKSKII